ncbi:MAG: hypothetical protein QM811_31540 [Pirellulales bacterium]
MSKYAFVAAWCLSAFSFLAAAPLVAAPVVRWEFGSEEQTPLISHGGVHRDVPGPRPPEYPDFEVGNTAVKFDGKGAHFAFADPGLGSGFDFKNGDAITIEAWVKLDDLRDGENLYLIGKGRTGARATLAIIRIGRCVCAGKTAKPASASCSPRRRRRV